MKLIQLLNTIALVGVFPCVAQTVSPTITTQPHSQFVRVGDFTLFQVAATGTDPLSYQWRKNNIAVTNDGRIFGAQDSDLGFFTVHSSDAGTYSVVISNSAGIITSSNAVLTVIAPPTVMTQPANITRSIGGVASLTVETDGSSPFSYQWQLNDVNVAGATSSKFIFTNASPAQAGKYRCLISNIVGATNTTSATLTLIGINNYAGFTIVGPPGAAYRIDYSNDLQNPTNWIALTNIGLPSSPYIFVDVTSPGQPRRTYRAIPQ